MINMPEGPEVTQMTNVIRKHFLNTSLKSLHPAHASLHLPQKIISIQNKGKFVYLLLQNNIAIGITPGMTGHLFFPDHSFKTMECYVYHEKHNHAQFVTTKGSFFFNDPRKFGRIKVFTTEELKKKLDDLGPDLLRNLPKMSLSQFQERLNTYRPGKPIADLLLDQSFIAGVGNYLRAEALYLAKIHPLRKVGALSTLDVARLKRSLERVGRESYEAQKKNLHTYKFKIYQQPQAKSIRRFNRSIWYDPRIQKIDL